MEELMGTWRLTGTFALTGRVPFIGEEPDPTAVGDWLAGSSDDARDQLTPAEGLRLTIDKDGTFTEEKIGDPKITWYDSEGVLQNNVNPFDGTVKLSGGKACLMSEESDPLSETIRYDDGDTKISDTVAVLDGKLLRTVSIVTDELYLDRVLLQYEHE